MEMSILVFDSGVLMWKVQLSKSETIWSMVVGAALLIRQSQEKTAESEWGIYSEAKRSLRMLSMSTFW